MDLRRETTLANCLPAIFALVALHTLSLMEACDATQTLPALMEAVTAPSCVDRSLVFPCMWGTLGRELVYIDLCDFCLAFRAWQEFSFDSVGH